MIYYFCVPHVYYIMYQTDISCSQTTREKMLIYYNKIYYTFVEFDWSLIILRRIFYDLRKTRTINSSHACLNVHIIIFRCMTNTYNIRSHCTCIINLFRRTSFDYIFLCCCNKEKNKIEKTTRHNNYTCVRRRWEDSIFCLFVWKTVGTGPM